MLLSRYRPNKQIIWVLLLLGLHIFLRFYELEERFSFSWDQLRDAWMMRDMLLDGNLPLLGPVAKANAFNVGAAYYYLLLPFYFVMKLDPLGAGLFAGVISIMTLLVLFYVSLKVFNYGTALVSTFIYAISFHVISFDRVAWNVDLIPLVSLVVFYSLYRIREDRLFYILVMAGAVGFAFHVHFTAVFYPIIILLSLPFLRLGRKSVKYILWSLPIFIVWFIPYLISGLTTPDNQANRVYYYINTYYHGLHLRRVIQLAGDAFIEFAALMSFKYADLVKYFLLPLFSILYLSKKLNQERVFVVYLFVLWFIVPWLVFSVYSGEITQYYFASTGPMAVMVLAYLVSWMLKMKKPILTIFVLCLVLYYAYVNLDRFFHVSPSNFMETKKRAVQLVNGRKIVKFVDRDDPVGYFYDLYWERL